MSGYTYTQVLEAATEYFSGDEFAAKVFVDKYALQTPEGEYLELTPVDMHRRLAKEFARIEKKYPNPLPEEDIFSLIDRFKYIVPQGSPMSAIGNPYKLQSLGNCFVIEPPYDSYGGILKSDQELAQLMKRRCVEESSNIITKERGILHIKDVKVGEHVLSFDIHKKQNVFKKVLQKFETDVEQQNRISIYYSNGTILNTSNKHPVLCFSDNKYSYVNGQNIKLNDINIRPPIHNNYEYQSSGLSDIGWFIGAHIGDGSCDIRTKKDIKKYGTYYYEHSRFRICGDNEQIIIAYKNIFNNLCNISSNHHISYNKNYKTTCWEYVSSRSANKKIIEKYFDNQTGLKTYSAFIPQFVKDNNLWWDFIAGLIDSDGHIKNNGERITIGLCAKKVINDVASFLQSKGISTHVSERTEVRDNEEIIYILGIHYDPKLWQLFAALLRHDIKKSKLLNHKFHRNFSLQKPMSYEEVQNILIKYESIKYDNKSISYKERNLLSANICNLKKDYAAGIGLLNCLLSNNLISEEKRNEILQRVSVIGKLEDKISNKYVDIEVEDTNNFYCGNFGFVIVHNCGVGLDISNIRPIGMNTNNAAKTTDGIAVFMERFSNTCREVAQGGRRGALLQSISIKHPEIETFIHIKRDLKKVTGANISIKLTDDFMTAVKNKNKFKLQWPVDSDNPEIIKEVDAKEIWDKIIDSAWTTAEPGIFFWDHLIKNSIPDLYASTNSLMKTTSSNPCGEIPLGQDSCRLLVINLTSFVVNPFTKKAKFDYKKFHEVSIKAQRLMDDIVDLEIESMNKIINKIENDAEPQSVKQIELDLWKTFLETCTKGRRTGLGITGLGDCLAMLNIKYGSKESITTTGNIYKSLAVGAHTSSCIMAKERGAFPLFNYNLEKNHSYLNSIINLCDDSIKKMWKKTGRRNIALTTTAPTGSVSVLTQTTSGIEPAYLLSYVRRKKINPSDKNPKIDFIDPIGDKWQEFTIYHHGVKQWMDVTGETDITKSPYWGATSNEVDWVASVDLQAIAQKYIDHSISKTCNLPNTATKELVSQIYMRAWESGCKGFTVYRDGCRTGVLISEDAAKKANQAANSHERPTDVPLIMAPKRPLQLPCEIKKAKINGEAWTIFVGLLNNKPYEIFGGLSKYVDIPNKHKAGHVAKNGKNQDGLTTYNLIVGDSPDDQMVIKDIANIFENKTHEAFTRMVSLNLRHGTPIQFVVEQLTKDKYAEMTSFSKVVARVLKSYIKDGSKSASEKKCESCGMESTLVYQEGCITCTSCKTSKCG